MLRNFVGDEAALLVDDLGNSSMPITELMASMSTSKGFSDFDNIG